MLDTPGKTGVFFFIKYQLEITMEILLGLTAFLIYVWLI